jgi:hypothetical protein
MLTVGQFPLFFEARWYYKVKEIVELQLIETARLKIFALVLEHGRPSLLSEQNTLGYNSGVEHGAVLCKREALSESILDRRIV